MKKYIILAMIFSGISNVSFAQGGGSYYAPATVPITKTQLYRNDVITDRFVPQQPTLSIDEETELRYPGHMERVRENERREAEYRRRNTSSEDGNVSFHTSYGESGDTKIYIEGQYVGTLTKYFKDKTYIPECGQDGTLSIRLGVGTYNYTASDNKYTWKGTVTVTKNGCARQGLRVE